MDKLVPPRRTIHELTHVKVLDKEKSVGRLVERLWLRGGAAIRTIFHSLNGQSPSELFAVKTTDILGRETAKAVVTVFAVPTCDKVAGMSAIAAEKGANRELLRRFRCDAFRFLRNEGAVLIFALSAEDDFKDSAVLTDLGFRRVTFSGTANVEVALALSPIGSTLPADALNCFREKIGYLDVTYRPKDKKDRPVVYFWDGRPPMLTQQTPDELQTIKTERQKTRVAAGLNLSTGELGASAEFETESKS